MENNNLLLKIEASLNSMRPSEQKVARFVLNNYDQVIYQTVSELAANSEVSEASVMRFIKSLGFKGFQYFKLSLASLKNDTLNTPQEIKEISDNDSIAHIKETLANNCIASINDTFSMLNNNSLQQAVELILKAKQIFLIGVGASGIMAQLMSYNLLRLGIISKYISDTHLQAMLASLMGPEDLVIGVSHSGSTRDTVDAFKAAKENGSSTICITGHLQSPIAKYSDVLLCSYSREDPLGNSEGRSSLSQSFVIETLTGCIYTKIKDKADHSKKVTAQAVLEKLY